ncbi:MAG TPA: hypothetical protein VEX60_10585 [Pyrinomonadaceae bacterium]|nr:hypothetical protein [Pyrinomonadaceae bacterium]
MQDYRKVFWLIIAATAVAGVTTVAALNKQGQSGDATLRAQQSSQQGDEQQQQQARKLKEHLDKFPAADYDAPEDPDPDKRAKRRDKGKKYNEPRRHKYDASNPVIGGGNNEWEWTMESTLPVKQSSAIIVGTVSDAKAFLSEDKTNIYSEYSVQAETVIKNFDDEPVRVGDTLVAERQGGRVRLRSGDISGFFISGQNPPQVGRRYVLFLGYNKYDASNLRLMNPQDMSRHILTGYELRGGKVVALDDPGGMSFKKHDGENEAAFLDEIRRLLADPAWDVFLVSAP